MSKERNKKSTQVYINEDEVNINNYPYYRTIPIQSLGDKKRRIIEKFKIEIPNEEQRQAPQAAVQEQRQEQRQEQEQTIIPAAPATTVYENTDFVDLPKFNLVKMGVANCYKVDMTKHFIVEYLKKSNEQLEEKIRHNTDIIESQLEAIKTNDLNIVHQLSKINYDNIIIEQLVSKINYDNITIQSNTNLIQEQVLKYNHNNAVLHNQSALNNTEIMNQQQILITQHHQITEYQAHIEQLQSELESYNQQISYHNSMLNAFNTVTQNPEYFMQLMAATMCNPVEIDDIHYNNTI